MKSFGVRLGAGAVTILFGAYAAALAQRDKQNSSDSWSAQAPSLGEPATPIADISEETWLSQPSRDAQESTPTNTCALLQGTARFRTARFRTVRFNWCNTPSQWIAKDPITARQRSTLRCCRPVLAVKALVMEAMLRPPRSESPIGHFPRPAKLIRSMRCRGQTPRLQWQCLCQPKCQRVRRI